MSTRLNHASALRLADFYTDATAAGELLRERRQNVALRRAIEAEYGAEAPAEFGRPCAMLSRPLCTPDREFGRFLERAERTGLPPLGVEMWEDVFHASNFAKVALGKLPIRTVVTKDGRTVVEKMRVIEFDGASGRRMCDLVTLWGEPLSAFHARLLTSVYPQMAGRVINGYHWMKRHGPEPNRYYYAVMAYAVAHYVMIDDFDIIAVEDDFTTKVVLPAFRAIEAQYGLRPLVVKISEPGEQERDPFWWSYTEDVRELLQLEAAE